MKWLKRKADKGPKVIPEWEKSHTTIHKHYKHIILPLGGVALVGSVTAAVALPLYIKSKYETGLGNFIDEGGHVANFEKDKPITYVAMGDSITAGYNGFFHGSDLKPQSSDYLSYADFLAQDLKNAGLLKDYKNYAKSGDTIWDTNELVDESQAVNNAIKEADLITISISSNDLLGAVSALGLPFATSINKLLGNVQLPNHLRDAIHPDSNTGIGGSDKNKLIANAVKKAADLLYKGKTLGVMDIRDGYQKTILDIIKRGLMILTRDMHQAAPKAHIKFIMPEFPLIGISKSLETESAPNIGKSIPDFFKHDFFDAVKEGISAQYTSFDTFDNGFKNYIKGIDDIGVPLVKQETELGKIVSSDKIIQDNLIKVVNLIKYKNPLNKTGISDAGVELNSLSETQLNNIGLSTAILKRSGISKETTVADVTMKFIKYWNGIHKQYVSQKSRSDQYEGIINRYKSITVDKTRTIITNEFMNDFADIHPSVRGHQVMGNYLFKKLLPSLTSSKSQNPESFYQLAVPNNNDGVVDKFEEIDQIDWTKSKVNGELHLVDSTLDGLTVVNLSRAINKMITQNPDGVSSPLRMVLDIIKPMINGDQSISTDVYNIDLTASDYDHFFAIKGATPGFNAQAFLGSIIKNSKTDRDTVDADDKFWATISTILSQELIFSPDAKSKPADPTFKSNAEVLQDELKGFDMENLFGEDVVVGNYDSTAQPNPTGQTPGMMLKELLGKVGINASGEYASAKEIDWTSLKTLLPNNNIVKDVVAKPYLESHIKTIGDLFSIISRSKTVSLFRTFILREIPEFLSDGRTADFKGDLPSMYERSIALADGWGLDKLSDALKKANTPDAANALEELFQTMGRVSSISAKDLKSAQSSMDITAIVKYVTDDINSKADPAQKVALINEVTTAFNKYKKLSSFNINSGFQELFKALHMVI